MQSKSVLGTHKVIEKIVKLELYGRFGFKAAAEGSGADPAVPCAICVFAVYKVEYDLTAVVAVPAAPVSDQVVCCHVFVVYSAVVRCFRRDRYIVVLLAARGKR